MLTKFILTLGCLLVCSSTLAKSVPMVKITGPLDQKALIALVSGNSAVGVTSHSHSLYELYFAPNGDLYFYKNHDKNQQYIGKWWVTGSTIHSQWKTYKKKSTENQLEYYHLYANSYIPYNKNEACDHANTFCSPFIIVKGDVIRKYD